MKKKVLALVAVIVCLLTMTGCGNVSKEKMLSDSPNLDSDFLYDQLKENYINGKDNYVGKTYIITAGVKSILDDHVEMYLKKEIYYGLYNVYFNKEDMKLLKENTVISFVGKITNIEKKDSYYTVEVKNAYYVSDTFDVKGELLCWPKLDHCEFYSPKKDAYLYKTYVFERGTIRISGSGGYINGKLVGSDDEITARIKLFVDGNRWKIKEIDNVEVQEKEVPKEIILPDFVNGDYTYETAKEWVENNGMYAIISKKAAPGTESMKIVEQNPAVGTKVNKGDNITIYIAE